MHSMYHVKNKNVCLYMHIFLHLGASSVESIDEEAGLPEVGQLVQVAIVRRVS